MNHRKDITCLLFSALLLPSYGFLAWTLRDPHSSLSLPLPFPLAAEDPPNLPLLAACLLVVGVAASGPKTLLGLMVRNAVPLNRMGLTGGVLGFVGQIGGAVAGSVLGSLIEVHGWEVFFPTLFGVSCLCSGVIVVFMWYEKKEKEKNKEKILLQSDTVQKDTTYKAQFDQKKMN